MDIMLLTDLLRYDAWANRQMATHLINVGATQDPIARLMNHLLACHNTWLARARGEATKPSPWATFPTETWADVAETFVDQWLAQLTATPEGPARVVAYTNTSGNAWQSPLYEMVLQLCTHGTYHRGQINQHLAAAGLKALPQDYILYKRR